MSHCVLGINPATDGAGTHDPGAALLSDGEVVFGAEEERYSREKHAENTFPRQAITACLNEAGRSVSDLDKIAVSWKLKQTAKWDLRYSLQYDSVAQIGYNALDALMTYGAAERKLKNELEAVGSPLPAIEFRNHHRCHAASAFHPSGFDSCLVLTIDGRGESESTVVWEASGDGLERIRAYPTPNSWGMFYSTLTEFLGYRSNNGEGKVMGLAAYGSRDEAIESAIRSLIDTGVNYDVTDLFEGGFYKSVDRLEDALGHSRKSDAGEFTDWEKDLAHVGQALLEETVLDIVTRYCRDSGHTNVALAGGVALNCKLNKRIMESDVVDNLFVQPVAHDAGTALGAGYLEFDPGEVADMSHVYWGPQYDTTHIETLLDERKIEYTKPSNLEQYTAEKLVDGQLVGWFQGRTELGPRALGNRSILADSRTVESRDRVNDYVKHREGWRPFAPSMLEKAAEDYLVNAEPAPYMIKTFDVKEHRQEEIPAVLHPGDSTTRPQTVQKSQNPRYYDVIRHYEDLTGVPVVLNTSFNDHGEPIVNTPVEALKDFYGMGLDLLVIDDIVVTKPA